MQSKVNKRFTNYKNFSLHTAYTFCTTKRPLKKLISKEEPTYLEEVDYTGGDYVVPQYKQSRQKNLQLVFNGYVYCRDSNRGTRVYW